MRIRLNIDGHEVSTGSRSRYVVFRLTMTGGFSVASGSSAEEMVRRARRSWAQYGWRFAVVDTVDGDMIARYPAAEERMFG